MKTPTQELKTCLKQIWLFEQTEKKYQAFSYLHNYVLCLGVRAAQKVRVMLTYAEVSAFVPGDEFTAAYHIIKM